MVLDPDGLRVHKSMCPELREFAPITAILDAADGNPGIRRRNTIDEHTAGVEITGNPASQIDILRPEISTESKLASVRSANCFADVRHACYRCNGTECLVVEGRHAFGNSAQHGGGIKGALAFHGFASA